MKWVLRLAAAMLVMASTIPAPVAAQDKLFVDASTTGAPISKYVYGQFVEHLGRSIYGGLWAEMLEDRKFARPITDEYNPFDLANDAYGKPAAFTYLKNSPWKVIGPEGTVRMDKVGAYVGEWSPVIHLPGDGTEAGISQGNEPYNGAAGFLAVERGKSYAGHIVLAAAGDGVGGPRGGGGGGGGGGGPVGGGAGEPEPLQRAERVLGRAGDRSGGE